MKVLAIRADNGGCGKYRIEEPSRVVSALGFDVTVDMGVDAEAYENTRTGIVEVKELHIDADLLVIQRPLNNSSLAIINQARKQGIATVVDIDDDFLGLSKYNVAYDAINSESHTNAEWLSKACAAADWLTVSSQALMSYAPHGRVSVLRNNVPKSIFDIEPRYKRVESPTSVGWTGTVETHPTDLQITNGRVGSVLSSNNLDFKVVGDGAMVRTFLKIPKDVDVYKTGWVDIEHYYNAVVSTMDIGIVPLEMSNFNQAKSHLKGIEMAALGIPFIASPTREYERLAAYGVGKTIKSVGDWSKYIQRWIDRPDDYFRDAKNYRDAVEAEFTYENHATEWAETWTKAVEHAKSSR